MLYEKRLLVLSGAGSGCVRLERTSAGINAVLSVNNIGGSDFLVIVRDDSGLLTFVPTTLSRPFSFALPASIELTRITVIVAAGERLLLSGTLRSERLWQGNLEDEIKRARKLLGQRPPKRSVSDFFFDIMTSESYDDSRVAEVNYYRSNLSVDKDDIAAALSFGAPFTPSTPKDDTYAMTVDENYDADESESGELNDDEYETGDFAIGFPDTEPELDNKTEYDLPSDEFAANADGYSFSDIRNIPPPPPANIPPGFGGYDSWTPDNNAPPYVGHGATPPFEQRPVRPFESQQNRQNIHPSEQQQNRQNIHPSEQQQNRQNIRPSEQQQNRQNIRPFEQQETRQNMRPPEQQQSRQPMRPFEQQETRQNMRPPEQQQSRQPMHPSEQQETRQNMRQPEQQQSRQNIRPSGQQENRQNMRQPEQQENRQPMRPQYAQPEIRQQPPPPPAEAAVAAPTVELVTEAPIMPPPISQPPPILGSAVFYDTVKPQIEKLFAKNEHYGALERLLPESKWIRVDYDNKGKFYLIGLIGEPVRYICYGVPGKYSPRPPAELAGYCQWLAIDENDPIGEGFWVMYQDAVTGKSIL